MTEIHTAALAIAAFGAMARFPAVAYAWLRTLLARKRFVTFRFGWIEILTNLEPIALLCVGFLLYRTLDTTDPPSLARTLLAALGAAAVLIGWAFQVWAFVSWPSLYAGHALLADQKLIANGAYAVVRHPAYFGVCLVWIGLTVAFMHPVALVIATGYAIPVYLLYLRAEESMLLESFGEEYGEYARRVPMLIPRLARSRRAA